MVVEKVEGRLYGNPTKSRSGEGVSTKYFPGAARPLAFGTIMPHPGSEPGRAGRFFRGQGRPPPAWDV